MNPIKSIDQNEENNRGNDRKIFVLLSWAIVVLFTVCALALIALAFLRTVPNDNPDQTLETTDDLPVAVTPEDVILKETEDAGLEYIGKMVFFGESTTAHLASRPGLPIEDSQVWRDSKNTQTLSSRITSEKINLGDAQLTIAEACAQVKPDYVVLSFGLNGIKNFVSNKNLYTGNYSKLIKTIQQASPETKIILQTVYPVSNASVFKVELETLNRYILTLNEWLPEIAAAHENVRVVDTASVLRTTEGTLASPYDMDDGIHLTADAYHAILDYLRTHAWE